MRLSIPAISPYLLLAKSAMKVFLDNVLTFVIQETIVNQLPRIVCPESVFAMKSDLVEMIASESEARRLQREEFIRKPGTLETGYDICICLGNEDLSVIA